MKKLVLLLVSLSLILLPVSASAEIVGGGGGGGTPAPATSPDAGASTNSYYWANRSEIHWQDSSGAISVYKETTDDATTNNTFNTQDVFTLTSGSGRGDNNSFCSQSASNNTGGQQQIINVNGSGTQATAVYYTENNDGTCTQHTPTISLGGSFWSQAFFTFTSATNIQTSNGERSYDFTGNSSTSGNGVYLEEADSETGDDTDDPACQDEIDVSPSETTGGGSSQVVDENPNATLTIRFALATGTPGSSYSPSTKPPGPGTTGDNKSGSNNGNVEDSYPSGSQNPSYSTTPTLNSDLSASGWDCWVYPAFPIYVTNVSAGPTQDQLNSTQSSVTATAADQEDACSSNSSTLSWIICPLITIAQSATQKIYSSIVSPLLQVSPIEGNTELKAVWSDFVTVADAFFVIAFMVMIFGTALSLNIDAYTIKKVLPRLVIAAILIQLSYLLCAFIIDVGNILGDGIISLILQTLHTTVATTSGGSPNGGQLAAATAGSVALAVGVGVTVAFAGPTLLIAAVGLLVSMVVFMLTLVLRQVAIVAMVIVAPIAIVAWILPNTERLFKIWLQNFIKIVLMYPIVSLLIGAAYVIQATLQGGQSSVLGQFVSMLAPTIAFFMIPATFKMAGSTMGSIASTTRKLGGNARKSAQGATQGALDHSARLQQSKADRIKNLSAKAQTGTGFGRALAQRRLGLGWAKTPAAVGAINTMRDKQEKEAEGAATRLVRDIPPHAAKKDAAGTVVEPAGTLEKLAGAKVDDTVDGIKVTEAVRFAALDKLAKTGQTGTLADIVAAEKAESRAAGGEDKASATTQRALSANYATLNDSAPQLVGRNVTTLNRTAVSKLDGVGMEAYIAAVGSHRASTMLNEVIGDATLSRAANSAGMLKAREVLGREPGPEAAEIRDRIGETDGVIRSPSRTEGGSAAGGPAPTEEDGGTTPLAIATPESGSPETVVGPPVAPTPGTTVYPTTGPSTGTTPPTPPPGGPTPPGTPPTGGPTPPAGS